ncbi:unnamed protein product [Linum tenue]|uniref:Cystatin domain-containing protein n=1 Tax=Linum tenue TaxID=586396 RepID=A0AAV0IJ47_9ROSI|nr:unnamed protein product [Linum tenue]
MRPITFLVAITTIALMLSTTGASFDRWEPIKNLKDEHIKEIAEFAVQHSNLISIPIRSLQLLKVQEGKIQQVAGKNYLLIVAAVTPEEGHMFGALLVGVFNPQFGVFDALIEVLFVCFVETYLWLLVGVFNPQFGALLVGVFNPQFGVFDALIEVLFVCFVETYLWLLVGVFNPQFGALLVGVFNPQFGVFDALIEVLFVCFVETYLWLLVGVFNPQFGALLVGVFNPQFGVFDALIEVLFVCFVETYFWLLVGVFNPQFGALLVGVFNPQFGVFDALIEVLFVCFVETYLWLLVGSADQLNARASSAASWACARHGLVTRAGRELGLRASRAGGRRCDACVASWACARRGLGEDAAMLVSRVGPARVAGWGKMLP